jgi:UDP-GlcNAc:undecaprenyl-phosphate GlcNAc-1-phosphate transferase
MKYSLIGWFLGSAALSFFCTWLSIKIFPKLKLLDFPRRYNLKRERIPYPGGIFFVLASIGLVFIDAQFWFLVPVIFLLGLISFIDDRRQLPAKLRLVLYVLLITTVIVLGVQIDFIGNPLTGTNILIPAFLAIPITILWIIGLQQSMNWFDGLKGLSVGISGIGFLFMGILSVVRPELFWDPGHQSLMVALWALAGLCFGAWWWYWQGKILLGDTGSQVLGFLLGVMSIFSGAKIGTTLMILALPLLDLVVVIGRRVFVEKKSPFRGDQKHLHHLLRDKYGEKKSVVILLIGSIFFGCSSVLMSQMHKLIGIGIVTILIGIGYYFLFKPKA